MDRSRKANSKTNEVTLQHKSSLDASLIEEQSMEKLAQLQQSMDAMKQTPAGIAMLEKRANSFGECTRIEGETSSQFYLRLRQWLDRVIPQTKSPLHPPRQND